MICIWIIKSLVPSAVSLCGSGATLWEIGSVHPNKNHTFHKIDLSDITRSYLFKIYISTDLFCNKKISNIY